MSLFPQRLKTAFWRDRRKAVFCLLVAQPPNPFSQNFILRLRTVPALLLPPPAEIFCKRRGWLTSIIAYCPVNGNGIFSKIRQARRAAARPVERSVQRAWDTSQQAKPTVSGIAGNRGFERLYIQTPSLPSSESLCYSPALNKNFSKSVDKNIRLCYHDGELNTAHIFHADT